MSYWLENRQPEIHKDVCQKKMGPDRFRLVPIHIMHGFGRSHYTVLGKKEVSDGQIWYLLDQESLTENPDPSVEECYIRGDLLEEK